MVECRECGYPVEEGDRFCGNCRAAVAGAAEPRISGSEQRSTFEQGISDIEVEASSSLRGKNPVLQSNASRVLLEGSVLPLEFRIYSQKGLSGVELALRSASGIHACQRVAHFVSGADIHLDVAVPKGCYGALGFEVVLKYRLDDKALELHGNCRHEICPTAGDGNITLDINQGHAGDIQVSGLKELAAMNDKRTLLRDLAAIEPRWEALPLQPVSEMALESNGHASALAGSVRLFAGHCLTFGRGRENDVVTRLTQLPPGLLDPASPHNPNRFISSAHGWLHRTRDGVFAVDGAMVGGKPSGGGTFLDGERIMRQKLPANAELSLAGAEATLPTVWSMRVSVQEGGVVLRPAEARQGAILWLEEGGKIDFEGKIYEHRSAGFFRDGEKIR